MSINIEYPNNSSLQVISENKSLSVNVSKLHKTKILVLYHFYNLHNVNEDIRVSYSKIAKKIGKSEKQAARIINDLCEKGFMIKTRSKRFLYAVCQFSLTQEALLQKERVLSLYKFYIGLMFSACILASPNTGKEESVLQYCLKEKQIYKNATTCSSGPNLFINPYPIPTILNLALCSGGHPPTLKVPTKNSKGGSYSLKKKKEAITMDQPWITPALKSATQLLSLSLAGQVRLAAYPPRAIEYAANVFKSSKSKKNDAFSWFASVCNKFCKENNVGPDWGLMQRLAIEYEIADNAELTQKAAPIFIPGKPKQVTSALFEQVSSAIRKKNQERIALNLPEDIARERAYLLANPEWLEIGKRLNAPMDRWFKDEFKERDAQISPTTNDSYVEGGRSFTQVFSSPTIKIVVENDMNVTKSSTEPKDKIGYALIEEDNRVWADVKYVPIEDGDPEWQEIF